MEPKTIEERLLAFHKAIEPIQKTGFNPHYKSAYVTLDGLMAVVRPALADQGLFLTQYFAVVDGANQLVTAVSSGDSSEKLCSYILIPPAWLTDPQKTGSALTYLRRYAIMAILCLAGEDDDGEAAMNRKPTKPMGQKPVQRSFEKGKADPPKKPILQEEFEQLAAELGPLLDRTGLPQVLRAKTFKELDEAKALAKTKDWALASQKLRLAKTKILNYVETVEAIKPADDLDPSLDKPWGDEQTGAV